MNSLLLFHILPDLIVTYCIFHVVQVCTVLSHIVVHTELVSQQPNNQFNCLPYHIPPPLCFCLGALSPLAQGLEAALALLVLTTRINGCFGNI